MATGTQPGHGSAPNPWQGEIDTLKLEITDLRATLGSLVGKIEELERVKTEAVSGVFFHFDSARQWRLSILMLPPVSRSCAVPFVVR